MRELFALAIDRTTGNVADEINYEIGRSISYDYPLSSYWRESEQGFYASALHYYVQLKLALHRLKTRQCWWFSEGEEAVWLDREAQLRAKIKAARAVKGNAIWGDLKPEK